MSSEAQSRPRIAPLVLPDAYVAPQPPPSSAPAVLQDTYRQTKFLLSEDLRTFSAAMELQLQVQRDSYPSKFRTQELAALSLFWSRSYSALRDAATLLAGGGYSSIPHLSRTGAECIGVQGQLLQSEMDVYESWLENAFAQDRERQALDLNLGRYRAAGILASDEALGQVYRITSDLSLTPFGGSVFLTAPESNRQRLLVAFGDQAFHAGYAELMLGWLLRLCERQLAYTEEAAGVFNVSPESHDRSQRMRAQIDESLKRSGRCRAEEIIVDGERRYLIHNFRRSASGAPKRIIL